VQWPGIGLLPAEPLANRKTLQGNAREKLQKLRLTPVDALCHNHALAHVIRAKSSGWPNGEYMIRTSICLDEDRRAKLSAESKRTGAPVAELVRRAIDLYIEAHKNDPSTEYRIVHKPKEPT
jgi:hypothetical protein